MSSGVFTSPKSQKRTPLSCYNGAAPLLYNKNYNFSKAITIIYDCVLRLIFLQLLMVYLITPGTLYRFFKNKYFLLNQKYYPRNRIEIIRYPQKKNIPVNG